MTELHQAESQSDSIQHKPKKSQIFRRTLIATTVLLSLPITAVVGVISSETGTKWALKQAESWVDGLQIGEIDGKLQNGLRLNQLQFQSQGVNTQVEQADVQLDFSCLLRAKLCLENLSLSNPHIQIDTALLPPAEPEPDEPATPMQRISLPLSMEVKNVSVNQLHLNIDQQQIQLGQFHTVASLNNETGLTLQPTEIKDVIYIQSVSSQPKPPKVEAEPSQPLDWAALEQQLTPALLGNLNEVVLPFDVHLPHLQGINWQYQQMIDGKLAQIITMPHLLLQADATGDQVRLENLQIQSSLGEVQSKGNLQLSSDFPLNVKLHSDIQPFKQGNEVLLPKSGLDLSVSGNLKKDTALSLKTQGVVQAELQAKVQLNEEKTPFEVQLNAKDFRYPFANAADPLILPNLTLKLQGNLLDYQGELQIEATGMGIPNSRLKLSAQGGLSQANIQTLQLNSLDGQLNLAGNLDWKQGIEWQTAVDLNKIHLGGYMKTFPAVLSGKLASSGKVNTDSWQVDVPMLDIQGTLSQRPLSLKGTLTSDTKLLLNTPQLVLNYGENRITAKGKLAEQQSDFTLAIQAPNLRGLVPDLAASLKGNAKVQGNIREPNLELDLVGSQIQYQDLKISKFSAKGNVRTEQQIQGDVLVDLTGLSQGDIKLNQASLKASGNEKSHQLQLRSQGEPVAASLNLSGSFDRSSQQWKGTLSQVGIKTPMGEVKNSQDIGIKFDYPQTMAQISAHCWKHRDLDLCFPQAFNTGKNGEIPFELKRLNLALVNKLAKQEGLLQGQLKSTGKFAWFENKPLKLNMQLQGDSINVAQKIDYRTFKLAIPKLSLNAQLDNHNLAVKSDIAIQQNGRINTELKINDIANARQLGGTLNLSGVNLNLANQLLSSGENLSGNIDSRLSFAGNLNAPLLKGAFNINNLKAKMKASPVEVSGGSVALNFFGNHSTLTGDIQTPDSHLSLNGKANWKDLARWDAQIHAQAEDFSVNIPAMAKIKVSSDVTVKATPTLLDISGKVDIPWARIAVESLPESAVAVSADEVILDSKTAVKNQDLFAKRQMAATTQSGMAIKSDLKINIGKDVNLKAYGLDSNLEGLLAVRQEKGQLGLYGQIDLKNGRYASFGQDLLIRKGQINFSGLPSQPLLNIEAIRNPEAMEDAKVTAGVKVRGVADSPTVDVFSEPSMPQDQALSYILTGRSLENSGETGSSGSVGAALLGMGLAKSGKLVGGIGEAFGIQDLNLGTAGVGDSSKVVVSGNITPRLKVKYGVGLFDGLAEVTLRYRLFPQFFLQSVSGVNQAFDVLYEFEF